MGKDHSAFFLFLFIFCQNLPKRSGEGNAFHLRKIIETGNRIREQLGIKFSAYINF